MAVTIQQEPTTPNIANNDLLYVLTSTQVSQPQFQYVCDIKDNSGTLIQRIKQQANPSAKGVFNTGQIMTGYFTNADRIWDTAVVAPNTGSGLNFIVEFGEEYAASVSASVVLYNGISATPGEPAKSGSVNYFNLYGVNESALDLNNWNWNSSSKYDEELADDIAFTHQFGLTSFDTQSVYDTDYGTISFLNGNAGAPPKLTEAQNVYAALYKQYDVTGSLLSTDTIYNETIYNNPLTEQWVNVYLSQSQATRLAHFPSGPQNMVDAGITLDANLDYYTINFVPQLSDGSPSDIATWGLYTFNIGDCSGFTPQRFAWKNIYGVWDYYNFIKANNRTSTIQRKEYTQTFVNYSTTGNTVPYDQTRRGRNNHYNDVTKQRQANSDWLTQTDADNLRELFYSADVYYYEDSYGWIPVVISDASITERTNDLSQKTFQYAVNYEYAVGQYSRQ